MSIFKKLTLTLVFVSLLSGCAPQGIIRLPSQDVNERYLKVTDLRSQKETGTAGPSDCSSFGKEWVTVNDSAFSYSRVNYLQDRLSSKYPRKFSNLKVSRFQTCYTRPSGGGAAFAGISYALALVIEANKSTAPPSVKTVIEFDVDGVTYSAQNEATYTAGPSFGHSLGDSTLVNTIEKSIVNTVNIALEKIN